MRKLNASENDPVFIKNCSFLIGKIFYLMQRKPRISAAAAQAFRRVPDGARERA
jgi:hypothetical protein